MTFALYFLLFPVVLARPKNYSVSCQDGLILPAWLPKTNLPVEMIWLRGAVYFLSLGYIFLGVSIISDKFMSAIEKITSQERCFYVPKESGGTTKVFVRVWNETVANLTLMALGSSCPEIMLSVIEIYAKNYEAGELGPGTIVGSAAYNLFSIIALCVSVIPKGQTRRIKRLGVFFVTASWSVFAYLWLYYILAVSSEGVVEVWEAVMTLMFFPLTVLTAYAADKHSERKEARAEPQEVKTEVLGDTLEQARLDYADILKDLKSRNPLKKMEELEWMAEEAILSSGPKSRAYYRVMVIKDFMGEDHYKSVPKDQAQYPTGFGITYFRFEYATYTVLESVGVVDISVVCEGADLKEYVVMEYQTDDGSAKKGVDYISASGILVFRPGDTKKCIPVEIIDDCVYEMDEYFYLRLINVKSQNPANKLVKLAKPNVAKIVILDDDHAGTFEFEEEICDVSEKEGVFDLPIIRAGGTRGTVKIPYWTKDGTAEAGIDYIESSGYVVFENEVSRRTIPIGIVPENSYERNVCMYVELGQPEEDNLVPNNINHKQDEEMTTEEKVALEGRPRLGNIQRVQINIRESDEFKNTVDKLVQKRGASAVSVSASSWGEQFVEAIRVNPDGGDGEEVGVQETTGCGGYIMHFLTLFWKVLFAFVPPAEFCSGWLCFWSSIIFIGLLTAVIGDVSSHLGCTVGLKDAVTAICFVAMGTSLPDTFASKVSAIQDSTADNSVGNVTGSNAVNVFLGIGVAWSIAAIYHSYHGNQFIVPPGNLGFSVMLFCTEALFAILILMLRRSNYVGGELGGPTGIKYITSFFLFGLWILYLTLSTLEAYGVIHT